MAQNVTRTGGIAGINKDSTGGGVVLPHACLGIVKDNIDPTHSGRIKVYINQGGAVDTNDSRYWYTVSYLSPYFGVIAPGYNVYGDKSGEKDSYGKFIGNPHSYGFWATAPDVGTTVMCLFVNGRSDQGYYIGCVPEPGLTHMVPAIGSASAVVPNPAEANTYGGADRLPVTEVNNANPSIRNNPAVYNLPKPVHSYQAGILAKQGLTRDNLRGTIGTNSQRETPSRVFGISTPGGPVYTGGYDKTNIAQAAASQDISKLQTIGRTGGHTFVMDDGDDKGQDQLIRIRTSGGHMIMMNDSGQNLTIMHGNGQTWIELGREGTIDMYATNSVNIRTEGDLNLHADRDINLNAKRNIQAFAENIKLETDKNMTVRTNMSYNHYTAMQYTVKVEGPMSLDSQGAASIQSAATTFVKGKKVNLNSGATPIVPQEVQAMGKNKHVDTTYSSKAGWMAPSPEPLVSLATRVPTHWPYEAAGQGVDVKTGSAQPAQEPQPSPGILAASMAATKIPGIKTIPSLIKTAPTIPSLKSAGGSLLDAPIVQGMMSQQAVAGQSLSATDKIINGIVGSYGTTLASTGIPGQTVKPGAEILLHGLRNLGAPVAEASKTLMTGNFGVQNFTDLVNSKAAQSSAQVGGFNLGLKGLNQLGIIKGTESSTQIAGVVQAAANFGVKQVAAIVSDPAKAVTSLFKGTTAAPVTNFTRSLTSSSSLPQQLPFQSTLLGGNSFSSAFPSFGSALNGGNYAGIVQDKLSNGVTGLSTSLQAFTANKVGEYGKQIGDLTSKISLPGLGGGSFNIPGVTGAGSLTNLAGNFGGLSSVATQATTAVSGFISQGTGAITNFLGGSSAFSSLGSVPGVGAVLSIASGLFGGSGGIGSPGKNVEKVADLVNSFRGTSRIAYTAAENSFLPLRANQPNFLGGSRSILSATAPTSAKTSTLETQSQASNELVAAQQQVADAKTLYRSEPTEANLAKIRAAELAASEALKKVQSVTKTVLGALTPNSTISAQDVEAGVATITAQISGEQATATTLNSGINALPGGFGAYVNEVSKQNANIVKTVRTLTSATTSNTGPAGAVTGVASSAANTAADGALTQAKNFVGNIVNKTTTAVSSFVDSTLGKLGKVPVVGGLLAGAAKSVAGGLLGKTFAGLGSLGNNGGQIRSATVAKDTFVAAPQQSVKIAQLLNNPLVPKPDFVETRFIPSNDIAGEQIADINRLSQINQLEAERDKLLAKYNEVQLQLATAAGTNIGNIQKSSNDLNALNKQLAQVNTKISAITDTWFG